MWHYKCIRPILNGPTWPNFLCPNCRAVADLEADVEDMGEFEEWDDDVDANDEPQENGATAKEDRQVTPRALEQPTGSLGDLEAVLSNMNITDSLNGIANQPIPAPATPQRSIPPPLSSSITQPVTINITNSNEHPGLSPMFRRNESDGLSPERAPECPMTPRNDAGPFVLDGSAGRGSGTRTREESPNPGSNTAPTLPPLRMD